MQSGQVRQVVIVGGGTAGWIAAAAMAKLLSPNVSITLVESEAIGTVGVGEATIPQIRRLNGMLGLDEDEVLAATQGTFKLGIEFSNWGRVGERYLHTFGEAGINLASLAFHQYWLRARAEGSAASLWDYSLHQAAANAGRFGRLERIGNTPMAGLAYAFHFDAGLYARYLRGFAESKGVTRIEGRVVDVALEPERGHIASIALEGGRAIDGDLFVDCTGFRGLLIGEALGVAYQDWSHWLPCNRALAVASERTAPLLPYTKSIAHEAGWQWRIPLQHRTGNGHVFCDSFISEEAAAETLLSNLDGAAISEPKPLRFTTGRRDVFWEKNCVAIGLSSGFLEPLESTSIHLIQSNVSRLIELFPGRDFAPALAAEYNRQTVHEFDLVRDFLILHYHLNQREDSEFWRYCANMDIPDTLKAKLELFEASGVVFKAPEDIFREASWVQVMLGQNLMPKGYHDMAGRLSAAQLRDFLAQVQTIISRAVDGLPRHEDFIAAHCRAPAAQ